MAGKRALTQPELIRVAFCCRDVMTAKSKTGLKKTFYTMGRIQNICYEETGILPSTRLMNIIAKELGVEFTSMFDDLRGYKDDV